MSPPEGLYRCWVHRSFRRIKYAVDGVYVNAGLKGRGNHDRIILLGRRPRSVGFEGWKGSSGIHYHWS